MPGVSRCDRGDDTRVLPTHCTRGCGCNGHPAFPTPSWANGSCKTRAPRAARANAYLNWGGKGEPGALAVKAPTRPQGPASLVFEAAGGGKPRYPPLDMKGRGWHPTRSPTISCINI